ncbi:multidrug effflux MFS transporter [Cereibacter sp. SYSU M97828]|nr:multidrug effflux MFS transporter [Cereibacter flavus]
MTTRPAVSQGEFIALIATMIATVAFSIDSMLPSLPAIAAELTPDAPNHAQLIVTFFMLGMGVGTFFVGPLSDAFGRKTVMLGGAVLYCAGALIALSGTSLEAVLVGRLIQGLGGAGPRIVALAMVRDLYKGREMARVVSFIMMVFTLVPAVAPMAGSFIIAGFGWRGVFVAFVIFSLLSSAWMMARQPETLPIEARRPLRLPILLSGTREVLTNGSVLLSIGVQALIFGCMFATITSVQQIFDVALGRGDEFPYWFALGALLSGASSFLNARLVVRLGMRYLITAMVTVQFVISTVMALSSAFSLIPEAALFPAVFFWFTSIFFMMGMTMGNLNAMALEPMGHLAGLAASVIGGVATVLGVMLASPVGLSFNGTVQPLAIGVACFTGLALLAMRALPAR